MQPRPHQQGVCDFAIVLAAPIVLGWSAPEATAGVVPPANILYFSDGIGNGTDEMAAALAALPAGDQVTIAMSPLDFVQQINIANKYQLGIFDQEFGSDFHNPCQNSNDYSTALNALGAFVALDGKAIVDTWNPGPFNFVSGFGANYATPSNGETVNQLGLPSPAGGAFGPVGFINLTAFDSGVSSPVALSDFGLITADAGLALAPSTGSYIAATYTGTGRPPDGEAAIIVGDYGHSIVNGFLNDTAGAAGEQIYENEINALFAGYAPGSVASSPAPEPSSSVIASILFGAFVVRLRTRPKKGALPEIR